MAGAKKPKLSKVDIAREIAFRRGLQQGAYYVVRMLARGQSLAVLQKWAEVDLYNYRFTFRDRHDPELVICQGDCGGYGAQPVPSPIKGKVM